MTENKSWINCADCRKSEFHECQRQLSKVILSVRLNMIDFSWRPSDVEGTRIGLPADTRSSHLLHSRLSVFSQGQPNEVVSNVDVIQGVVMNWIFGQSDDTMIVVIHDWS